MSGKPSLILNLRTSRWLIRKDDDYWIIRDTSDALILAGFLKIEVLDGSDAAVTQNAKGTARVEETDEGCKVILHRFVASGEDTFLTFGRDADCFASFDCDFGVYGDSWVATRAQFSTENIATLQLRVFLPPAAGGKSKKLSVVKNGHVLGEPAVLSRGKLQEVTIYLDNHYSEATFELISEYAEEIGIADQRLLGFVLAEYSVENDIWEPASGLVE